MSVEKSSGPEYSKVEITNRWFNWSYRSVLVVASSGETARENRACHSHQLVHERQTKHQQLKSFTNNTRRDVLFAFI